MDVLREDVELLAYWVVRGLDVLESVTLAYLLVSLRSASGVDGTGVAELFVFLQQAFQGLSGHVRLLVALKDGEVYYDLFHVVVS